MGGTRHIGVWRVASPYMVVRLALRAVSVNGDVCVDVDLRRRVEIATDACGGDGVCDCGPVPRGLATLHVVAWLWLERRWSRSCGMMLETSALAGRFRDVLSTRQATSIFITCHLIVVETQ